MDTCIICGNYVPEGRQICENCARQIEADDWEHTKSGLLTDD